MASYNPPSFMTAPPSYDDRRDGVERGLANGTGGVDDALYLPHDPPVSPPRSAPALSLPPSYFAAPSLCLKERPGQVEIGPFQEDGHSIVSVLAQYATSQRFGSTGSVNDPLLGPPSIGMTQPAPRPSWAQVWPLISAIAVYMVAATGNVVLLLALGHFWALNTPMLLAALQKASLPFTGTVVATRGTVNLASLIPTIFLLSVLGAVSSLGTVMGVHKLSGPLYVVTKSADLPINALLGLVVLRKRYTALHVLAIVIVLVGIAVNVRLLPPSDEALSLVSWDGLLWTLLASLADALSSVLPEAFLTKPQFDTVLGVVNFQLYSSTLSSILLIGAAASTGEIWKWSADVSSSFHCFAVHSSDPCHADNATHWTRIGFVVLLCLLPLSKIVVSVIKFVVVQRGSALTFSMLKAPRRLITLLVVFVLLHTAPTIFNIIGGLCSVLGVAVYVAASWRAKVRARSRS